MSARLVLSPDADVERLRARIVERVVVEDRGYISPCWISNRCTTGGNDGKTYTAIGVGSARWYTHRLAYIVWVGPIPPTFDIDHLCEQTRCCNPEHLDATSHRGNMLRGDTIVAHQRAQEECVDGHPFDDSNTRFDGRGRRHCRACDARRSREYRARRIAA